MSETPWPPDASALADLEMTMMADGLLRWAGVGRAIRVSNGGCYAAIVVDGRVECYGVESDDFHRLVGKRYREATGRALSADLLRRVMETLRARAESVAESKFLCLRRSRRDGWRAYLADPGDRARRLSEERSRAWKLANRPGVRFWKPAWQRSLPEIVPSSNPRPRQR